MDNRKSKILEVTRQLINEKGLENTSTNDIARTVGISRGTLYHHFESKEAILDALVERMGTEIYKRAREIAGNKSIPVVERMLKTVLSLNAASGSDQAILEHLNSPDNIILHQKVQKEMMLTLPGILVQIVEDGNKEGIFKAQHPYECMEMLIAYMSLVFDDELAGTEEIFTDKIVALTYNMERMLGAAEGTFSIFAKLISYGNT